MNPNAAHRHRAACLIRRFGWQQGPRYRDVNGFCLVGALSDASLIPDGDIDPYLARLNMPRLIQWNQTPGRTKSDVLRYPNS